MASVGGGMSFCALCLKHSGRDDFCLVCEKEWATLVLQERGQLPRRTDQVLSSYAYRGVCRSSILAFKSKGFRRIGSVLLRRILAHPELADLVQECQVIMPAPSSLWSRWHGRLDLAAFLALGLGATYEKPVCMPPFSLGFRWGKQALRSRSERRRVFRPQQKLYDASYFHALIPIEQRGSPLQVLIVDDVVTTGNTLTELADLFENVNFKFYTLASALRLSENMGRFDREAREQRIMHAEYRS